MLCAQWNKKNVTEQPYLATHQKALPTGADESMKRVIEQHLSVVLLKGDYSSFVEVVFVNPEKRVATSAKLKPEIDVKYLVEFLCPGEWVVVTKVVPTLSNKNDTEYRKLRGIEGRYSIGKLVIPESSQQIRLKFRLHPD